jgi:hypothetical protein
MKSHLSCVLDDRFWALNNGNPHLPVLRAINKLLTDYPKANVRAWIAITYPETPEWIISLYESENESAIYQTSR